MTWRATWNRLSLAALLASALLAAQSPRPPETVSVAVPEGVPLQVVSSDFSDSEFEPRGGALVVELSGSVRFRHAGRRAIRAVTLAVDSGHARMGGLASVSVPSLHAGPDEEFEVRLSLRLLRPLPAPEGPLVRVTADAVLLDTLATLGPDRLNSSGQLRALEMEARRDRAYLLSRWQAGGRGSLASAMQASIRRQASRPRLAVRLAGNGPATAAPAASSKRLTLALVDFPDSPLALERGWALVNGPVSAAPRLTVRNRSRRGVRRFDIGWLVRDAAGGAYSAGSAPVGRALALRPGESREVGGERRFELKPVSAGPLEGIEGMDAWLRSAELDDGSIWIPSRQALEEARLLEAAPASPEEQRLTGIYRSRGPAAVLRELRRLRPQAALEAGP